MSTQEDREPKLTVILTPEFHRRLKMATTDKGISMSDLTRDLLQEWLDRTAHPKPERQ